MIKGLRLIVRDKDAFQEENGILRQTGKPMDVLRNISKDVKVLHLVDLNAKKGNATNFDLYDRMTYLINIEVEVAPKEELVRKLLAVKARAVLDLPCKLDLKKFIGNEKLLVGKINDETGDERNDSVFDYYVETEDLELVKKIAGDRKKRILVYSKKISEKELESAGAFALIRDCDQQYKL